MVYMRQETIVHQKIRSSAKVGRNDPCPCGSGRKFKKCCIYRRRAADLRTANTLLHKQLQRADADCRKLRAAVVALEDKLRGFRGADNET